MTKKTRLFIGLGFGAVLIVAYLFTAAFMGAEIGEPCDEEWGCQGLDAVCLEGEAPFCSMHCDSDDQCPDSWTCGDVRVLNIDGKTGDVEESSAPVCLPG